MASRLRHASQAVSEGCVHLFLVLETLSISVLFHFREEEKNQKHLIRPVIRMRQYFPSPRCYGLDDFVLAMRSRFVLEQNQADSFQIGSFDGNGIPPFVQHNQEMISIHWLAHRNCFVEQDVMSIEECDVHDFKLTVRSSNPLVLRHQLIPLLNHFWCSWNWCPFVSQFILQFWLSFSSWYNHLIRKAKGLQNLLRYLVDLYWWFSQLKVELDNLSCVIFWVVGDVVFGEGLNHDNVRNEGVVKDVSQLSNALKYGRYLLNITPAWQINARRKQASTVRVIDY